MNVITNCSHYMYNYYKNNKCTFCNKPLSIPFIEWHSVFICGPCCRTIKEGLTADLIHVAAIMDLRAVGYWSETFARTSIKKLEDETRDRGGAP
jgi:hypothetical protein